MAIANNFSFVHDERDITLINRLPPVLQPIYDFRGMCDSSGYELRDLYLGVNGIFNDQFIQTASSEVLAKWEAYCGIIPNATDTLEERRFRILTKLNDAPPYTDHYLENRLNELCGEGYWRIVRDYNRYSIVVELSMESLVNTETVMKMVKDIIPANLELTVQHYKARHYEVGEYTHEQLAAYSHQAIADKQYD